MVVGNIPEPDVYADPDTCIQAALFAAHPQKPSLEDACSSIEDGHGVKLVQKPWQVTVPRTLPISRTAQVMKGNLGHTVKARRNHRAAGTYRGVSLHQVV